METTTTTHRTATHTATALPESDATLDMDFIRRGVQYMVTNGCEAAQIISTLTIELDVSADMAHELLSETTALVAA